MKNKKTILEVIIIFVLIGLFASYKIINNSIGYDTDALITNPEYMMNSWLQIGRYFLVFLKHTFNLYSNIDIRLFNILTYINVFIYSILFLYFIKKDTKESNILKDILCIFLIVSSPLYLEQYNFTLQSPEVSFSMILVVLSFITTYNYLKKNKTIYALLTILLLLCCFGTYQAFISIYITGVIICLFKLNKEDKKININNIIKTIILFVLSFIGYTIISKLALHYNIMESSSYLSDMILWLKGDIINTILVLGKETFKILIGYGNIRDLTYTSTLIITILFIAIDKHKKSWNTFYYIVLLLSPFLLNTLTGSRIVLRSFLSTPIVCSFIFYILYDKNKYIKYLLIILVLFQVINSQLLLINDYKRYQNDIKITDKIYSDCKANKDTIIIIKGIEKTEENIKSYKGEEMGYSFLEWGDKDNLDINRTYNFMKINNKDYTLPSQEQYNSFDNSNMKEYPEEGYYIKKDNICYVNLGK